MADFHEDSDDDFTVEYQEQFYVPPGWYAAEFAGFSKTDHPEYGPGLRLDFRLLKKKYDGAIIPGTGKRKATAKNFTGRVLKELAGAKWDPKNIPRLSSLVGTRGEIEVVDGTHEGTCKVKNFKRVTEDDDED